MCGLAGYNCSLEEAQRFGRRRAARLAQAGWEYNLHRGVDAHGYMVTYHPDLPHPKGGGPMWTYKTHGSALQSIAANNLPEGKPVSMALHTRDFTLGSPLVNENNHPIRWGNVFVTHNGSIDNDITLKEKYKGNAKDEDVPDVDSVVLPMMLNELITDPLNEQQVRDALDRIGKEVKGAFTFHAMWVEHPGVSLIAMGKDRPLVFAYQPERDVFVYASEKDAVAVMLDRLGIKRSDTELLLGTLKTGSAIMLHYGKPLFWHSFEIGEPATRPQALVRYDGDGGFVESNHSTAHWTKYGSPLSTTVYDPDKHEGTFFRIGTGDEPSIFNIANSPGPTMMRRMDYYFDAMFCYIPTGFQAVSRYGVTYYAWKDGDEFIFDDSGKLVEIYDWDNLPNGLPWVVQEPAKAADNNGLDFDVWLIKVSNDVPLPSGKVAPAAPKKARPVKDKSNVTTLYPKTVGPNVTVRAGFTVPDNRQQISPNFLADEANRKTLVGSVEEGYAFLHDIKCEQHSVYSQAHGNIPDCDVQFNWAKTLLASVQNLDEMVAIYDVAMYTSGVATHPGACAWFASDFELILIGEKQYSWVIVEEECDKMHCSRKRQLVDEPAVLTDAIYEREWELSQYASGAYV